MTLSWMLLLTPVRPPVSALQWYDPSNVAVTFRATGADWFPSETVPALTRT